MSDLRAEIVGPFTRRELVVGGYTVPGIEAAEEDGGRVLFVVDHRLGYSVAAADFEQVACLVADVFALAAGLSCHPGTADNPELFADDLRRIPILMRPRRLTELAGTLPEHECEPDALDPRNDDV